VVVYGCVSGVWVSRVESIFAAMAVHKSILYLKTTLDILV